MKFILFFIISFFVGACSKSIKPASVQGQEGWGKSPNAYRMPTENSIYDANLDTIRGRAVESLLLVVFPEGKSEPQWVETFKRTERLSWLRDQIFLAKNPTSNLMEEWFQESSFLIIDFFELDSVYLASFGESERCAFTHDDDPWLNCNPMDESVTGGNPLDGGVPRALTAATIGRDRLANGLQEQVTTLQFKMGLQSEDYGNFSIRLKLRPEPIQVDGKSVVNRYQGDGVIESQSQFYREGALKEAFPVAYIELRLKINE